MQWAPSILLAAASATLAGEEAPVLLAGPLGDQPPGARSAIITAWMDAGTAAQGVLVQDASGRALGASVLADFPGEPVLIAVDASGTPPYHLRAGTGGRPWELQAGVVVESRARVDGPADTLEQARALWRRCTPVQGITLVPNVFLGINACGPTIDFASDFIGYFTADAPGAYRFATDSDDASFISVDDAPLVAWGGWHGIDGGRYGEHASAVVLTPGVHKLEYLYVQNGDNPVEMVAWTRPGGQLPEVMPPGAFVPVGRWQELGPASGAPWCSWQVVGSCRAGGQGLDALELTAHGPADAQVAWSFDDGGTDQGRQVVHVFPHGGQRQASCRIGVGAAPLTLAIAVHPRWDQVEEWSDHWNEIAHQALRRRPAVEMPADDVLALVDYAAFCGESDWIRDLGLSAAENPGRWGPSGCTLLARLGFELQDSAIRRYDAAMDCWKKLLQLAPGHGPLRDHVALHFAGLLVDGFDRAKEGEALLEEVDPAQVSGADPRLLLLYRGDAAVGLGDVESARALYRKAGDVVDAADLLYSVRRRMRLEAARAWCNTKEWEQALQAMREIEWETPMERLGTETGLIKVRAYLGRGEVPFAIACCKHMLQAVGPDDRRADVLLALATTCLAGQDRAQALEAGRLLIKDHPYSEAAATVKDLLPELTR